jgi:hypothetical protein
MNRTLLYYKPSAFIEQATRALPGTTALTFYSELYKAGAVPVDRTGTIRSPVLIRPLFPIPTMRVFSDSLEQVCNARAHELLTRADRLDTRIYTLWSGGIDSTLALVSLLKNATDDQKKRITVLLSRNSIAENTNFYYSFIRGRLDTDVSSALPAVLGSKNILVSGEHNDQLFGSDIMASLIPKHGPGIIHQPYDRTILLEHFTNVLKNAPLADFYLKQFERLPAASPIPIVSLFEFVWWINFSLKWQTVYTRTLTYTTPTNAAGITPEYLRDYYAPFYNTDEFQLWSLNNPDKRIKDSWVSYKWPCKEIIYDFTKDADYRDTKIKVGSLASFVISKRSYRALDADLLLHDTFNLADSFVPSNDFAAADALVS